MRLPHALAFHLWTEIVKKPTRLKSFSFLCIFLVVCAVVVLISYISLRQLIIIDDSLMIGTKKQSSVAEKIRCKIIEKYAAQPFQCKTEDGIKIAGLYIERKEAEATLLICHGYRCCKELTAEFIKLFPRYNIVLFDFRSHGENKPGITTIGCHEYKDVLAVTQWIHANRPLLARAPLVILGISMGGAAMLHALHRNPNLCNALIIDSSFSCLKTVLYNTFTRKSGLPTFPFFHIMSAMFNYLGSCDLCTMNPVDAIARTKRPILIIHSCIDEVVPVQESLLIYSQANKAGTKLWIAPKAKHGWLHKIYPQQYKKKVEKFLSKNL